MFSFFFFNDTATTEIYTLSLHDALPIYFAGLALRFRHAPRCREQSVHVLVTVLGLMVEQHEPPDACLGRKRHRLLERRVAPPPMLLELRGRVHRVVDQQLGVGEERPELLVP